MDHLETEARNPASMNLDALTPIELARLMNREDARVVPAVASQVEAIARAIDAIADRLHGGGRLIYIGAGTSGRLGVLDATECPPTFNSPPGQVVGLIAGGPEALTRAVEGAEDHPEFGERDLQAVGLTAGDAVVGIATSGRTPYVLGGVAYARRVGALTVGISCNTGSEISAAVDLAITPVVGPEVLSGSTRLKAGTATKLVLNMLSTGAMVRLGKAYGNLMVDLRATNSKLRARTNRIVRQLTGRSAEEAGRLLERCDGELKTALVTSLAGVSPQEARQRLARSGGRVSPALGETTSPVSPVGESNSVLYLGIDGGGSRTVALLAVPSNASARGWSVVGRGESGPSNRHAVGDEAALAALDEAVGGAFAAAGLPRCTVRAACLGLAGVDRPEDRDLVQRWAAQTRCAEKIEVTNDAALLIAAGTPEGWGVALVAGTGSIAYGRAADGRTARAGGWGYLLGDEGSGYAIALAGLRVVACAADGRAPPTLLTERFLKKLALTQPAQLIPTLYRGDWDRPALAALAPVVLEAAGEDATAADIVRRAAGELARTVSAVVEQLGWAGKPYPLALAGGLLTGGERYRAAFLQALAALGRQPWEFGTVEEPAEGAIHLARWVAVG